MKPNKPIKRGGIPITIIIGAMVIAGFAIAAVGGIINFTRISSSMKKVIYSDRSNFSFLLDSAAFSKHQKINNVSFYSNHSPLSFVRFPQYDLLITRLTIAKDQQLKNEIEQIKTDASATNHITYQTFGNKDLKIEYQIDCVAGTTDNIKLLCLDNLELLKADTNRIDYLLTTNKFALAYSSNLTELYIKTKRGQPKQIAIAILKRRKLFYLLLAISKNDQVSPSQVIDRVLKTTHP